MNNNIRNIFFGLLIAGASIAYGAVPPITVLVADSSGKAAYRGAVNSQGTFATPKLSAGNYVVQFNSKSAAVKGQNYALFVSAGKKKVQADSVAGEKFNGGGVAMKIDVAAGLNISGQVTSGLQTKVDKEWQDAGLDSSEARQQFARALGGV